MSGPRRHPSPGFGPLAVRCAATLLIAAACLLVAVSRTSATHPPQATGAVPPIGTGGTLGDLLYELVRIAGTWNPAGRASLAVVTSDGVLHGINEDRPHVSASSVKALWTAAAIDLAGVDAAAPHAHATLAASDNHAAGRMIDLVGIDAVNTWSRQHAGMPSTHTACWSFGSRRMAQSALAGGGCGNLTTAADLAAFHARLHGNKLLSPEGSAQLRVWLSETPRRGMAGALLAGLPTEVAAAATHKAGWLPPGCCRNDHRLIIDAGAIPLPGGEWFAVAAVADRGRDYGASVRWVGYAACRVYKFMAGDRRHKCRRGHRRGLGHRHARAVGIRSQVLIGHQSDPKATNGEADS